MHVLEEVLALPIADGALPSPCGTVLREPVMKVASFPLMGKAPFLVLKDYLAKNTGLGIALGGGGSKAKTKLASKCVWSHLVVSRPNFMNYGVQLWSWWHLASSRTSLPWALSQGLRSQKRNKWHLWELKQHEPNIHDLFFQGGFWATNKGQ